MSLEPLLAGLGVLHIEVILFCSSRETKRALALSRRRQSGEEEKIAQALPTALRDGLCAATVGNKVSSVKLETSTPAHCVLGMSWMLSRLHFLEGLAIVCQYLAGRRSHACTLDDNATVVPIVCPTPYSSSHSPSKASVIPSTSSA